MPRVAFSSYLECKDCCAPVVIAEVRGNLRAWASLDPQGRQWHHWMYCANPICSNHVGEGVLDNTLDPVWTENLNKPVQEPEGA